MEFADICLVICGLIAAGLIKGATGIGFSTCALPFLVAAVGLKSAMAIVILPALWSNIGVIAASRDPLSPMRRFWIFYAGIVPGIFLGAAFLVRVDNRLATEVLAVVTLAYIGLALARPDLSLTPSLERRLALPAGLANGVLTGLTGSQILPLMPYMMSLKLPADEQVKAVNMAVTIASVVLAAALWRAGVMTIEMASLSLLGCLPAALGVAAGSRMRDKLSASSFRYVALVTLAALALSLYGRHPVAASCTASVPAPAVRQAVQAGTAAWPATFLG